MKAGASFLELKAPRVFSMPPGADFLPALARGIGAALPDDSLYALSDAMVLAPTRRAARALGDAFAGAAGAGEALLLPRIRAIGDIDADEPPFAPGAIGLQTPSAISAEQRLFDLAALVRARLLASGQSAPLAAVLAEAEALARLIDEAETEGVAGFDMAREDFQQRLAGQPEHVQRAARFLEIVMQAWPQHLREIGASDPAAWRTRIIKALAEKWQSQPPDHMVIAAGSTGSVPATADLLGVIAGLPKGAIILPGLDESLSDADWKEVLRSPGHPQHGMARLLNRLNLSRAKIRRWPGADEPRASRRRRRLVNEALLPAEATADWTERLARLAGAENLKPVNLLRKGLTGITLVEADNEEEEALVLALAIRHTLEEPGKSAMLVTPERGLGQRVRAALMRWNIDIDDSAGTPLDAMPAGVFLNLLADCAANPEDPVVLAALLGTPLAAIGMEAGAARDCARKLEAHLLRGVRRRSCTGPLRQAIEAGTKDEDGLDADWRERLADFARRLETALAPLAALAKAQGPVAVSDWAEAHAQAAEALATDDEKTGPARLWCGPDGKAAAALGRALMHESQGLGPMSAPEYAHLFATLSHNRPVRPAARPAPPRARILGPLEARMMDADLVALGGLNEGVWPSAAGQDPFLPRSLRLALGLPDQERRLGLAAHDFASHASKNNVLLTRSRRSGTDPAVASRWLWRLKTLIRSAAPTAKDEANMLAPAVDYLGLARALDRAPARPHTAQPPAPVPPFKVRPRSLYVTRIKTLTRNPYGIYARFILNLKPLEDLGATAGPAERGGAVHKALEQFLLDGMSPGSPQAEDTLMALTVQALRDFGFKDSQLAAERARLGRALRWLLDWELDVRAEGWKPAMMEGQGALVLPLKGGDFTLKARADRLDAVPGGYAVLDYKTGAMPGLKEVWAGFDPQLPLEAAILEGSGFSRKEDDAIVRGQAVHLGYLRLSGGKEAGQYRALDGACKDAAGQKVDAAQLQARAVDQLRDLIAFFDRPDTPYLCQPRAKNVDTYSDYDLLARRPEWSAAVEEEGGGS